MGLLFASTHADDNERSIPSSAQSKDQTEPSRIVAHVLESQKEGGKSDKSYRALQFQLISGSKALLAAITWQEKFLTSPPRQIPFKCLAQDSATDCWPRAAKAPLVDAALAGRIGVATRIAMRVPRGAEVQRDCVCLL